VKNWNFDAAAQQQKDDKQRPLRRGSNETIASLWKIAGGQTYIGTDSLENKRSGSLIHFTNGVILDSVKETALIQNLEGKISGIPASIFYVRNNKLIEKKLANSTIKLSILIMGHPESELSSIIAPASVIKSILFRLYYLDAVGLTHFKKVFEEESPVLNTKIIIYQILFPKEKEE